MTRKATRNRQTAVEGAFPAVAEFVRTQGWIEIGDQQGIGFIVRALDYGGLVYESKTPKTLNQALTALERGIARNLER